MMVGRRRQTGIEDLAGQRVTSQRALLLGILRETGGHVDADELYRRARERMPRLSLSTVYRNLRLFKKLGLVDEHHLGEEHHHYEVKGAAEHYHLVCLGCGKIVEFQCPVTEHIKKEVSVEHGFEITNAEVNLEGYCPMCRETKGE